jgi:acetoin utilization deacetylase AcuC-like enzyme
VDIDVHFGNGTAELLRGDDRAFFASVHMVYGKNNMGVGSAKSTTEHQQQDGGRDVGFYPAQLGGTEISPNYVSVGVLPEPSGKGFGPVDTDMDVENGSEEKCGTRDPLSTLAGKVGYRRALVDYIAPALRAFNPQLLIISAGFDGYTSDPLGGELQLGLEDFQWSTARLCEAVAEEGKVVSLLEGGYDTDPHTTGLAKCVDAHVRALRGIKGAAAPSPVPVSPAAAPTSNSGSDSPASMDAED